MSPHCSSYPIRDREYETDQRDSFKERSRKTERCTNKYELLSKTSAMDVGETDLCSPIYALRQIQQLVGESFLLL